MLKGFLTFSILISLFVGVIFPNSPSFYHFLKKIKADSCQLPLSGFDVSDCEKSEEEKPDTKPAQPLEDVILPFDLSIFFFNSSNSSFSIFDSALPDHFLEKVSPPPKL